MIALCWQSSLWHIARQPMTQQDKTRKSVVVGQCDWFMTRVLSRCGLLAKIQLVGSWAIVVGARRRPLVDVNMAMTALTTNLSHSQSEGRFQSCAYCSQWRIFGPQQRKQHWWKWGGRSRQASLYKVNPKTFCNQRDKSVVMRELVDAPQCPMLPPTSLPMFHYWKNG